MSGRLPVAAGLVSGVLAAAVLLVLLVAFVPDPAADATPAPPPLASASTTPAGASSSPVASAPVAATALPPADGNFHIGETAPALSVTQLGGGRIDLSALRGKPVWVNFMQTTCPPCIDEFPVMNGFAARYADEGLVIVAVDVKEDEAVVAAFVEGLNTTFPVGLDPDGTAQAAWRAYALPVHFWIDAEGIVREGALGGIGPDMMAEALGTVMPGVEVTP